MLKNNKLSLEDLNPTSVYTFILGCNDFSIFPLKKEYLILRSVFTENEKEPVHDTDPIFKFRELLLRPFVVNLETKSFSLVQNILKSRRETWFYKLLAVGIPINYFVVYHDKVF